MRLTKLKARRALLILFLTSLFIVTSVSITLFIIGPELLVEESNPVASDAIIVLSGGQERLEHASNLYEKGFADTVIHSNSTEPGTTTEEAVALGISKKAL
ncbi:YdcF family protein [Halobacillus amylolyticus]|uniref:YdcF family protein n=1 Tax=Halobacillus amylolyticus TaxID=2932259 RepID=A0ABY4H9F1_9BACI|nr:hypothetical protein [Halobacillus amylolyticus]UOR11324.1 hypothetical protein MUO15_17255 [Halobacillus amylolyticus]